MGSEFLFFPVLMVLSWIYIYAVGNFCVLNCRYFGRPQIISNSKKMPNYGNVKIIAITSTICSIVVIGVDILG